MEQVDLGTLPRTRKEARALGSKFYYTGKPCHRGHVCHRYTSSGCYQCNRIDTQLHVERIGKAEAARQMAEYRERHPERVKATQVKADAKRIGSGKRAARLRHRRLADPLFRAKENLYRRLNALVRRPERRGSARRLLGCSWAEFESYLATQFTDGMTWENYGAWHIDHIRPCASFDLTDPAQQRECFHYTNLQPLWAEDNLKKGAKLVA